MRHPIVFAWLGLLVGLTACSARAGLPVTTTTGGGGSSTTTTGASGTSGTTTSGGGGYTSVAGAPGGDGYGGSTGSGSTGAGGGVACPAWSLSAECSQNPTVPLNPTTTQEYTAAISGRWLLCSTHESVFGVDGGDVGLEITPDHHWYKLFPAQGGATVRGAGFDEEGTWTSEGVNQLNLQIFGSGTVITSPALATTPRAMRLDNNGVYRGTYVIDPSVPAGGSRCAKGVDLSRSGACTPPPDTTTICKDDPSPLALGRWSRCGGTMPGAPAHDGIEFAADGTFYFLHQGPGGGLVRGTADTDHGMVGFQPGILCELNISLQTPSGTSWMSAATFRDVSPRQMWIYTSPEWGDPDRYTFVGP
jgi:hypothetical protein